MKHWDKSERLYKVWGACEGALQGLEECLAATHPDAAKHCGEIRRELKALEKDMEDLNLGFVAKDYSAHPDSQGMEVIEMPEEYQGLDMNKLRMSANWEGQIIITHPEARPYIYKRGKWDVIKSEGVVQ